MAFIDNLRRKMTIDKMADTVITSLKPPGSERHLDRNNMMALLDTAGYRQLRRRELDLYVPDGDEAATDVIVLDNDLPRYSTSVDDVVMRKNPIVKEMVSIRNIRKILVDTDVVVSKQAETVNYIRRRCIDRLDLKWQPADIRELTATGVSSLENRYADGVADTLALFSELLGFGPPPKPLRIPHYDITGKTETLDGNPVAYGPLVAFSRIDNRLRLVDMSVRLGNTAMLETAAGMLSGKSPASAEDRDVFEWLEKRVLKSPPPAF